MTAATPTVVSSKKIGEDRQQDPIMQVKSVIIETANTADAADTVPLTLADYGITTVLGVSGWKHTTDNEVVVTEDPTTAVSAGVLTLTVPAGTDNDKRVYQVFYI